MRYRTSHRVVVVALGVAILAGSGCAPSGVDLRAPEPIAENIDPRSPGIWVRPTPEPIFLDLDSVPVFEAHDTLAIPDLQWVMRDYYIDFTAPDRYASEPCRLDDPTSCWFDSFALCAEEACYQPEDRRLFVERMGKLVETYPWSPTVVLHATHAFIRFDHWGAGERAWRLVDECDPSWYCGLAEALVETRLGDPVLGGGAYERAFPAVPDTIRCLLEDVSALLPHEFRMPYAGTSCADRRAFQEHLWWLTDPLLHDGVNERRTEHLTRRLVSLLKIQYSPLAKLSEHGPNDQAAWMRLELRYRWGRPYLSADLRIDIGNHFVPDRFMWSGLDGPLEYRLWPNPRDEAFIRQDGPVRQLPHVVARFLEGDSLVVAVVSEVPLDSIEDRSGTQVHFVASPEPGAVRTLGPTGVSARASFLATLPEEPHLTGIEVVGPDYVGRSRFPVLPLRSDIAGAVISDLLLFRAVGAELPETRQDATARMLSRTVVERGEPLGIYWEAYDVPPGPVSFELRVDGEEGGLFSRLGRAVGLVGDPREGRLEWSEEVGEAVFRRSITVETANLDPGEYTVTVRMSGAGGTSLERSVTFRVTDPAG